MSDDRLLAAARKVQAQAYAPYSRYRVGAALETEDGTIFVGCNVENASYGLTNCAERVAIGAAVSAGYRDFRRIVVVTDSDPPAPPCGACRQVLLEFGPDLVVDSVGPERRTRWVLRDLLPASFGSEMLLPNDKGTG
jgi:cytidine deaminase